MENGNYDYTAILEGYEMATGTFVVENGPKEVDIPMTVGIADLAEAQMNIYPNPSNGTFNIVLDGKYNVTIMNNVGQVVYEKTITNTAEIKLNNSSAGIYLIMVKSDNKFGTKTIVIE